MRNRTAHRCALLACAGIATLAGLSAKAQTVQPRPAAEPGTLKVEVASIRRNMANELGPQFRPQSGGFNIHSVTVGFLVELSYGVQGYQIVNAPGWMSSDRFDITAKVDGATDTLPPDRLRPIM